MDFSIKACDWRKGSANGFLNGKADVVVLGVFEAQTLTGAAREMDLVTKGLLTRTVKAGDMSGKAGSTLMLTEVTGIGASRILLVGLGKQDAFNQKAYTEATRAAWRSTPASNSPRSMTTAAPRLSDKFARTVWSLGAELVR